MTKEDLLKGLSQFVKDNVDGEFQPLAYYDKHLDCIRVQIKDCSFTEHRLSKIFTIWQENHVDTEEYIGFTIKGIGHLFKELGLPKSGVIKLSEIINAIVQEYPDEVVGMVLVDPGHLLR